MDTLTISKKNALAALKAATGENKTVISLLIGNAIKQDPMEFESYAEICAAEEIDPVASLPYQNPISLKEACLNGAFKLLTIFEAFNNRCGENFDETFEPDYSDSSQEKWYPWGDYRPSLGSFVLDDTNYTITSTHLGARLCTDTAEKARRIATQFTAEWNEFINPKLK